MKQYGLIYDGKMVFPEGCKFDNEYNPATGEIVGEVISATAQDVDTVVCSAVEAAKEFGQTSNLERAALLNKIADLLDEYGDELGAIETASNGKGVGEARMQAHGCADMYRYFAAAVVGNDENIRQHNREGFSAIFREPLGVVGLILPFNAPIMLLTWKLAPALAAGNCVVVKPSSGVSIPVLEFGMKLQEILPAGVFNVVCGSGSAIGNAIIDHPGINKVSFTGSTSTGRQIAARAGQKLIPATVELGGKSPIVVFDDADVEKGVQFSMLSVFSSAGAVCVAGSRLIVQDTIYDRVIQYLKEACGRIVVGDPMDMAVHMGPISSEKQFNKIMEYIETGKKEAELICGGERLTGGCYDKGFYIAPTVFGNTDNTMTIAKEEIFGPVLCVMKFHTEEEALEMANDTNYGLGGGVFTKDINRAIRMGKGIKAGTVWVNTYLASCPGSPFGGYKESGIGRELHSLTLDAYSNIKNINVDFSEGSPRFF